MTKLLSINLIQRIAVAVVGIPLLLWLVVEGGLWFFAFVLLLSLLAVSEFHHLAARKAHPPSLWMMLFVTSLWQINGYLHLIEVGELLLAMLLLLMLIALFLRNGSPLLNIGSILPGLLYVNLSFGALLRLRLEAPEERGVTMLLLLFICVWAADIFAYFGGSLLGGKFIQRKFFERHSPHKTWEGFVIGLMGSIGAAYGVSFFLPNLPQLFVLLTGVFIGLASPMGDLIESMFKRDAGVKDSSTLIPGHGGVLDRFDTILFVAPILYFLTFYYL